MSIWFQNRICIALLGLFMMGACSTQLGEWDAIDELGEAVVAIEAGERHICALLQDGTTRCWDEDRDDDAIVSSDGSDPVDGFTTQRSKEVEKPVGGD